jgi:hypothetical protein
MNDSCIIAPIHPPFFKTYGLDFVNSYNKFFNDNDLFLVFSNKEEEINFREITKNLNFSSIICDEPIGPSPITQKKFFGLKYVYENTNFKYAGVFDVDTVFLSFKKYDDLFKNYFEKKCFFANYITEIQSKNLINYPKLFSKPDEEHIFNHIKKIIEYPSSFYSIEEQEELKNKTDNFLLYFWFNDIPIYEKTSYLNFLKYINYVKNDPRLTYNTFDYILYAYYLLLKNNFSIKPIEYDSVIAKYHVGFLEGQHIFDKNYFSGCFNIMNPMWIKTSIDEKNMKNVFVKLHVHSPYN